MTEPDARPLVSVITTVYNAESFLEPTLRSLLAQTFTNFEAIVVDDGSTDASAALVQRLAASDQRMRFFQQSNTGFSSAVNRGLSEARGELIAFLDHDDLWRADKLARQVACFEHDESVGFVGCYSALLDANLRCTGWRFGKSASGPIYRQMVFCDLVSGGSVPLVRRAAIEQVGPFDPSPAIEGRSDWDMWLRLSRHCNYAMVNEPLVGYTRRTSNYSGDYQRMLRAGEAVLAKAAACDVKLDQRTLRRARARDAFGMFCLSMADREFKEAKKLLRHSFSLSWAPIAFAPQRWGIMLLFGLAMALPRSAYLWIWRRVARTAFKLTPGEPFIQPMPSAPGQSGDAV